MNPVAQTFLRYFLHPRTRHILSWLLVATITVTMACVALIAFDEPKRLDGNYGHTTIDFGGQWLMGRMLAKGLGRHLYHRNYQREVLREAYPQEDEIPDAERPPEDKGQHDGDKLLSWFIATKTPAAGTGEGPVGGPLYPPIHALLMSPLGNLRPASAYRIMQMITLLTAFVAGWGIRQLSQGRIWWPVAVMAVMIFPGFVANLNLGQNGGVMLALFIWGWVFIARGQQNAGGIMWGLLAFKPIWPAAFFLVPLLTGRWRVCLAMFVTGAALAFVTLPVVGRYSWLEWLRIGREASYVYSVDENWVFLSRDLLNIPSRWLLDFEVPYEERRSLAATLIGWTLLLAALGLTIVLALLRKDRARFATGAPAAFLLLGAFLSCYHFMYYDVVLTALPVLLLFTEPGQYLRPKLIAVAPVREVSFSESVKEFYEPKPLDHLPPTASVLLSRWQHIFVLNSMALSLLTLLLLTDSLLPFLNFTVSVSMPVLKHIPIPRPLKVSTALGGFPASTFCLLAFWIWSGWLWLRMPLTQTEKVRPPDSDSAARTVGGDAAQLV